MITLFSWQRWLVNELCKHCWSRRSRRHRPARRHGQSAAVSALESLETRVLLDAAPYVVQLDSVGPLTVQGEIFDESFSGSRTQSDTYSNNPAATPGVPYVLSDLFDEELKLGPNPLEETWARFVAEFRHYDGERSIGQPDTAAVRLEGGVGAYVHYVKEREDGKLKPPVSNGSSSATLSNTTTARIRIWDADCSEVGIPVTGNWTLESRLGSFNTFFPTHPFPGNADVNSTVTIRYWKAISGSSELVLDDTIVIALPAGDQELHLSNYPTDFELTTGSEIELEVSTQASATSSSSANLDLLYFEVTINPPDFIDLYGFSHYVTPSGLIDPQWIAVEYEVTREICYFDLELGTVAEGAFVAKTFDPFRISPEIVENNSRFRVANPVTGEIEPATNATEIGRHLLLIDSGSSGSGQSLQSQFEKLTNERIVVHQPKQQGSGEDFHGFFQAATSNPLVIRSDGATKDEILLDGLTAEFSFGGDVSTYSFEDTIPDTTNVPEIIVVTAGMNDLVLAAAEFDLPIQARLGDGNDVFVGGQRSDKAYGGKGRDALLGEGWTEEITSIKELFLDMLDLEFTLQAGLIPADGTRDMLYGGEGDDFLLGGAGDDHLEAGPGKAVIFGDSLKVTAEITVDFEDLKFGANIDFVRSGAGADTIIAGNDDTLVMGGGGVDTIKGNSKGISLLFGNGGDDEITGYNSFALIVGGSGDDTIEGSGVLIGDSFDFLTFRNSGLDSLKQGKLSVGFELTAEDSGNDHIYGENGFDFIVGGDGDDYIEGGNGLNIVFGDGFDLTVSIGLDFKSTFSIDGFESIFKAPLVILELFHVDFKLTGSGSDVYHGGIDSDVVLGGGGNDTLNGNAGLDLLIGGEGDDTVNAGAGLLSWISQLIDGDIAVGGPGNDVITGSDGPDFLASEGGNDVFYGLGGDDVIFGGPDADTLYGGSGNDRLYGEGGDDYLVGADGDDELYGGQGNDSLDPGEGNNVLFPNEAVPQVTAIVPSAGFANPTTSADIEFTVAFDAEVSGIDVGDFTLATTGTATGAITAVSHAGGRWVKVSVTSVAGLGTIGLSFAPSASGSVTDSSGLTATKSFLGRPFNVGTQYAPTIENIPDNAAVYQPGAATVVIEAGTVEDLDFLDFDGGTLTAAIIGAGTSSDRLSIRHTGHATQEIGIDGNSVTYGVDGAPKSALLIATFTGGQGTAPLIITFNANAQAQHVTGVLRAIAFINESTNPVTAPRTVGFEVTDGDGGTSDVVTRIVNFAIENVPPVITTSGNVVDYTAGDEPVVIDQTVTVFDADAQNFDGGTAIVTIVAGGQPTDRLGIESSGPISVNVTTSEVRHNDRVIGVFAGTTTLTISLLSNATQAAVQDLLRHITFTSISEVPSTTPRKITFTLTDGDMGTSAPAPAATVTVTPVNDPPIDIVLSQDSVPENQPIGTIVGLLDTVDPDAMLGDVFAYSFVETAMFPDNQFFTIDRRGHLLTAEPFDYDTQDTYSIRVRTTDPGGLTFDQVFTITVTDVNEAPSLVSLQNVVSTLPENTSTLSHISLADIFIADDDLGTNTLSLTGADEASFEIVGTQLFLKQGVTLDFESKSAFEVTVVVDDSTVGTTPELSVPYLLTLQNLTEFSELSVQSGQTQRSYVRYLDVVFDQSEGVQAMINSGRFKLTKYDFLGNNPTNVPLTSSVFSLNRNIARVDFGAQGVGGNRNTNAGDGHYVLEVDTNNDSLFESSAAFHRLLGDLTGDGQVDNSDKSQMLRRSGPLAENDVNGDGLLNLSDTSLLTRAFGRRIRLYFGT